MRVLVQLEVDEAMLPELLAKHRAFAAAKASDVTGRRDRPISVEQRRWLRLPEAAERAGLSAGTLRRACAAGSLRHVRVGGRRSVRLLGEWIDEWLERAQRGGLED